jgi:putative toxin-antitoxin system antitoxin component (TIGR02293 family)
VTEGRTRLAAVMERAGLDTADVARILDRPARSVSRWLTEEGEPRWEARERLLEVTFVIERLCQVIEPRAAQDWLFTPNTELGYRKPVELLREGRFREVLAIVDALGEGVYT